MDEKRDVPSLGNVPFFVPSFRERPHDMAAERRRATVSGKQSSETEPETAPENGAGQHAAGEGTRKAGRPVLRMPRLSSPGIVRCNPTAASGPMLRPMNYSSSGSFMLW